MNNRTHIFRPHPDTTFEASNDRAFREDFPLTSFHRPLLKSEVEEKSWVLATEATRPTIQAKEIANLAPLPTQNESGDWIVDWVITEIPASERYPTANSAKVAVNGWIDKLLSQITDQYPRHEIDSWSTKGEAARAVVAGTARADQTLLVQSEADMVSANLADQAALIVTKADKFAAIISDTSGLRQKTGTALDEATTPEQLDTIVDAALVEASESAEAHGLTV
jgi:hypothetical protein